MVRPFAEFLKTGPLKHIYGFGNAEYVMECFDKVERQSEEFKRDKYETDGTKLDANVSQPWREWELALLKRFYSDSFHDQVEQIHSAQYDQKCPKSKKKNRVNLGSSRRSGEGGTSLFNTVIMTCVIYCCSEKAAVCPRRLGRNSEYMEVMMA
jgi:hypothetical protein